MSSRNNTRNNYCTFCRGELSVGPFCPTCGAQVPCPYFLKGHCRDGDECPYDHIRTDKKKEERSPVGRGHTRGGGRGRGRCRGGCGGSKSPTPHYPHYSHNPQYHQFPEQNHGYHDKRRGPPGSHVYGEGTGRNRYSHDEYYNPVGYRERKEPRPDCEPRPDSRKKSGKSKKRCETKKKQKHPKATSTSSPSSSNGSRSSSSSPVSSNNQPPRECRKIGCSLYKKTIANAQEGQKCKGKDKDTGKNCKSVLKKCSLINDFAGLLGRAFR